MPIEETSRDISSENSPYASEMEEVSHQTSSVEQESGTLAEETEQGSESETLAEEGEHILESVPTETENGLETASESNGFLVVIDAGHQGKGNREKEPIGPGASEMKAKVSSGTAGCVSGWAEYELNLVVAMKLRDELEDRGY